MKLIRYFVLCMILGVTAISAHALIIGGSTGGTLTSRVYRQPTAPLTQLRVIYHSIVHDSPKETPAAYTLGLPFIHRVEAAFAPYQVKADVSLSDSGFTARELNNTKNRTPILLIRDTGKFRKDGTDSPSQMNTIKLHAALYEGHAKLVWSGTAQAGFWGRKAEPQNNTVRRLMMPLALGPQGNTISMREAVLTNIVQQIAADLSRRGFIPAAATGTPASTPSNPSPNT